MASNRNQRIQTDRLVLRRYEASDLEPFVSLLADEQVNALTGNGVYGRDKAVELFEKILPIYNLVDADRHFEIWGVERAGEYIGHVELKETDVSIDQELEIVYMLATQFWRQGFGFELVAAIRNHAQNLGRTVIATVNIENIPSLRLLDKVGVFSSESIDDETVKITLL